QAEDGIRDRNVTGVQTCALPISIFSWTPFFAAAGASASAIAGNAGASIAQGLIAGATILGCLWLWRTALRFELTHPIRSSSDQRSEERRVGKEGRDGVSREH